MLTDSEYLFNISVLKQTTYSVRVMSNLISGKEAFYFAFQGEEVFWRWKDKDEGWRKFSISTSWSIYALTNGQCEFKVKATKVVLNNIEIHIPKDVVIDPISGSVGLVYKDLDKAKEVMELLWSIFND